MLKLGKFIAALVLGLTMCFTLVATGVFAQNTSSSHTKVATQPVAAMSMVMETAQTVPQRAAIPTQATQKLSATPRGPGFRGGFVGGRGFFGFHRGFHRGFFFHHRFFFHRRFFLFPRLFWCGWVWNGWTWVSRWC